MANTLQMKLATWDGRDGGAGRGASAILSEVRAAVAEWLLGIAFELMPKRHPNRSVLRSCLGDYMRSTTAS